MNIIVCMKRIPDTSSVGHLSIDASGMDIDKSILGFKINEWDEYALEEAVQVKKKLGGDITAVTIGTEASDDMLRRALALGADRALRIDEDMTLADTSMVATALVTVLNSMPYHLILFGMQSEDFGAAQLGVMVAEMLNIPHAAGIVKLEPQSEECEVRRELEGGAQEVYRMTLPAVLTIQTGINHPRYPSYLNIRKAKQKELKIMTLSDMGIAREELKPTVKLHALEHPRTGTRGEILVGSTDETAAKVAMVLKDLGAL